MNKFRLTGLGWLAVLAMVAATAMTAFPLKDAPEAAPVQAVAAKDRPIANLRDLNRAFIEIAKAATPSVVTVSTEKYYRMRQMMNPFDPFGMFGQGNQRGQERQFKQQGLGSGVIISSDGYILTNNHVVAQADSISVRLGDGRRLRARVVGTDPKTDVAVIKIEASGLAAVPIGNSDSLQPGEMVLAIGSPLSENLAHTVTQGIVSAVGRSNIGLADYEDFIQTDAAINPGNSGGALVNLNGELVGLNAAIVSQSGGFQGIGFAVPINMAIRIKDALVTGGRVVRGYLGVSIQDITEQIAGALKLKSTEGALIGDVADNGPASGAGIESGDIVTEIDGKRIVNSTQLRNQIAAMAPGTKVTLNILRDGEERQIAVTLAELPSDLAGAAVPEDVQKLLGFEVTALNKQLAEKYDLNPKLDGVLVTDIDDQGSAYDAGLRVGDLIRAVNQRRVTSVAEFNDALNGARKGDTVLLRVNRGDRGFLLAFTL